MTLNTNTLEHKINDIQIAMEMKKVEIELNSIENDVTKCQALAYELLNLNIEALKDYFELFETSIYTEEYLNSQLIDYLYQGYTILYEKYI